VGSGGEPCSAGDVSVWHVAPFVDYRLSASFGCATRSPLCARQSQFVTGLNAQDRRTLYERGRNALLTESEAFSPPFRKSIIMKELIAFDEAIRKAEAEMARRAGQAG
jgi:hypothetical protein